MSERLHTTGENSVESLDTSREVQKHRERLEEAAKKAEQDPLHAQIESLNKRVEQQAVSGKEHSAGEREHKVSQPQYGNLHTLRQETYTRSLRKIRQSLNLPNRALSKVVHQKHVEKVSNVAAQTVARPSVFLGGSFGALLGSAVLLYASRHYGFTYNYTVMLLLFVAGFALGGTIEIIFKLIRRKHS